MLNKESVDQKCRKLESFGFLHNLRIVFYNKQMSNFRKLTLIKFSTDTLILCEIFLIFLIYYYLPHLFLYL